MITRIRSRLNHSTERGAALIWVAVSMVALLAMTALSVDLGWYYLNGARLQRAADSAALAGVMHLPVAPILARQDAETAASVNDFEAATLTDVVLSDNRYQVSLAVDVPTFFAGVVGIESLPLGRTATAEYVKPVPMGSPFSSFGVGDDAKQGFWAAIQAPYTAKEQGDPYMTRCLTATGSGSCAAKNPTYRPTGYYFGVDVTGDVTSLDIQVYDAGHYSRENYAETGDIGVLAGSAKGGGPTHFQVSGPDSTPLDPSDNVGLPTCLLTVAPETRASTYKNEWASLCSPSPVTPGIYVIRVWSTGNGGGSNHFALRATNNGTGSVRIYGINDMSVFTNDVLKSGTANIHLAEIEQAHAGKQLQLRFYDAGEVDKGNSYMTVKDPDNIVPQCAWRAEDEAGIQTASGSGDCRIQTTVGGTAQYNGEWITATIEIPADYTCTTDCWWKMDLELGKKAHDRTTWEARVIGNPVRLVPNS